MVGLRVLCLCLLSTLNRKAPGGARAASWWGGLWRPRTVILGTALSAPSVRGANYH